MHRFLCVLAAALAMSSVVAVSSLVANPDEETTAAKFVRGDTNNDGKVNISDAAYLLNYLFGGGTKPSCYEVGDINDDTGQDISDAVFLLRFLFLGDSQPPAPFPVCDFDPGNAPCSKSLCGG